MFVTKTKYSEQDIIEGIKRDDDKIVTFIYKNDYDRIKSMVNGFKNISLQPNDVFQEGITRAIINVKKGVFNGKSSFSTYLYGICRNICLKDYNRQKPFSDKEMQDMADETGDNYFEELQIILQLKEKLDVPCKQIIDLRFGLATTKANSTRFDAVAAALNITPDNARQRFKRCFSKLKQLVTKYLH